METGEKRRGTVTGLLKRLFGQKEEEMEPTPSATESDEARPVSDAEPIHVTDATFEETVLEASLPVLVDFWAPWCGPCRMIAPIVEELARAYDGRAVIAKMNTDEQGEAAAKLGIMGIPTLILFKGGQEVDRIVGYAPRHAIEEKLDAILG
jgi:thioredoxin 1